jgi:hypothetical protein
VVDINDDDDYDDDDKDDEYDEYYFIFCFKCVAVSKQQSLIIFFCLVSLFCRYVKYTVYTALNISKNNINMTHILSYV